jgi:hypothetical protein
MRKLMNSLSDPYLHLIAIGLLILRLTVGGGESSKPAYAANSPTACDSCARDHDASLDCARLLNLNSQSKAEQR